MSLSVKLVSLNNWSDVESVAPEALAEKLHADNVLRELLEDNIETKLFLDYEEYHDAEPSAEEKRRIAGYVQDETNLLKHMLIGLWGRKKIELQVSYKIATRHGATPDGRYKLSFRPFFSGLAVPFTAIPQLLEAAYWNHQQKHIQWDMSVYSRRRLLACVNGRKDAADGRLLTMERPDDDVKDYVAQVVEDDWHGFSPPPVPPPVASSPQQQQQQQQPAASLADVAELLPLIKPDVRDRWMRVGFMLGKMCGRSADGLEVFKEWSRGCPAKYVESDCEKVYMATDAGRAPDMGTLCLYASEDSPREYREYRTAMAARRRSQGPGSEFPFLHTGGGALLKSESPVPRPRLTDLKACKAFLEWLESRGVRLVKCEGTVFMYHPAEGIYKPCDKVDDDLRELIGQCGEEVLGMHAESTSLQNRLMVQIPACVKKNPRFMLDAERAGKRRLAWNNGVFDFTTKTLLPFSPDIILFFKLSHDYPTTEAARRGVEALVPEVRKRVVDDVWGENGDFVLQSTSRSYASDVEDKRYFFVVGDGNSGKGVWVDMNSCAFEGYTGSLCSKNLLCTNNNSSGDNAKALSWMVAARHLRLMATSELTVGKGVILDNNTIKELSSGGDTFCGRQNHKDEMQFRMQGTAWAFANDLPEIMNLKTDDATQNRVVFIEMTRRYLEGEAYEKHKHLPHVLPGDPTIKGWVKQPEVGAAFAYMVCHAYVGSRPALTPSIAEYTKTWCQGEEVAEDGVSDWLASAPPDAFVSCKDIGAAAAARGLRISSTKLGRIIRSELGAGSETRHVPGKGKLRGYAGLRIVSDDSSFRE